MELPKHMLLEPLGSTAEEIIQQGARDPAAVQRYLDCLERGWLGQALVERYTYTQSPGTPAGMLQTNSIREGKLVEWLKPIEDEIKDDLREAIRGGYDEMIVVERDVYAKAMENTNDPRRELLGQLVDMIDEGLQNKPKVCVTIKNARNLAVAPSIELRWCSGLEDTITRLSEKVLEKSVAEMIIKKAGHDFHISYQLDDAEDDLSARAMVEEMREWR